MSQAALTFDIVDILGSIDNAFTVLVASKGKNEITGTNNWLAVMLQGLFNKAIDEKLRSVEFETLADRKDEDVA